MKGNSRGCFSAFSIKLNHLKIFFGLFILFFTGCSLEPHYDIPDTQVPNEWKSTQEAEEGAAFVENWWEVFEDPTLNELEQQAIANNRDLYAALERVLQARAYEGVRGADLYPQYTLNPSYNNTGALIKVFGLPATVPPLPTIIRVHELAYSLPLNLNFELDLWGKLKNQYRAAHFKFEAEQWAWQAAFLTLTADLAANYFQLRSLDAQIELLEETIRVRNDAFDINTIRYDAGLINFTDVSRAKTLLYNAKAEFYAAKQKRALKENMIATLIATPASQLTITENPLVNPPPSIPAGLPSAVLLKRPDIKELERKTASEHALIGSAYASFFPDVSLTGSFGFSSPDLKDFLSWKSRFWSIGVSGPTPIFDGWRNASYVDLTWARFKEASALYQQKVLIAFQEVEDALAKIRFQAEEIESLETSAIASADTTVLSNERYLKGFTDYLNVSESERTELEVKRKVKELLGQRYVSVIQLIKALGGSWQTDPTLCLISQ